MGRIPERRFWQHPRPSQRVPFLWWAATHLFTLASIQLGAGFFSVFLIQSVPIFQIVIGAPVFEEMFKFGLALVLIAWAPRAGWVAHIGMPVGGGLLSWGAARLFGLGWMTFEALMVAGGGAALVAIARLVRRMPGLGQFLAILVALAVGAGFGILEHAVTYSFEELESYIFRVAFHSLSPAVSMLVLMLLVRVPDVRVRWLAPVLPIFLHYVNNASAVVLGIASLVGEGAAIAAITISYTVTASLVAALLVLPWMGAQVRARTLRTVARWFPVLPPRWRPIGPTVQRRPATHH